MALAYGRVAVPLPVSEQGPEARTKTGDTPEAKTSPGQFGLGIEVLSVRRFREEC
jgi:hypothetical protein